MSKTKEKEKEPKFDTKNFKENFLKGEMYHGILVNQKEINKIKSSEKTVLFKFFYFQNKLYFILYDYLDIYFSITEDKDILDTNKSLNSSLEFKDISSLIDFLKENLIIKNKNLIITYEEKEMNNDDEGKENISPENMNKTYYEFNLNSMVDILSIKWVIKCEKINNNITGLYNGISIDDAKLMIKCNYLGKKVGFSSSIIDLLSASSHIVNGIKTSLNEKQDDEDDEKKAKKKLMNKKNKYWGPMKHRKGEKIIFCEETDDKVTQSGASGLSDLVMLNENNTGDNDGILSQKESAVGKDKKKKKKHFI